MTIAHYLSLPKPGCMVETPTSSKVNPFGVSSSTTQVYQNLDLRLYISSSNYVPPAAPPTPYLYSRPGSLLVCTTDWEVYIDPNGCLNFAQQKFYYPGLNYEVGSLAMSVASTVPIPLTGLRAPFKTSSAAC